MFNEEEAAKIGARGDRRNTHMSSTSGATRVAPRVARDTSHPSCARAQRREMPTKHGTRTTFASRLLTEVPAPPRERMCDTGHDDPRLQPAGLLRRHTDQQEIHVIPTETAVSVHQTRIARKSGARQTSFLAHLGSVLFGNLCALRGVAAWARGKRPCICP